MPDIPTNPGDSKAPPASPRDLAVWTKLLDEANAKPKTEPAFDNAKLRSFASPGVCASCHPKEKNDFNLKSFDFNPPNFGSFTKPRESPAKAATEIKVAADTPESRASRDTEKFKQADAIEKTATVLNRLPEKLTIDFSQNKLAVQTDFAKLVEATPGVRLDPNSKEILSSIKQLSLNGDTFTIDFKDAAKFPVSQDIPGRGKATELSIGDAQKQVKFDVTFDAKNPDKVSFQKISGISLKVEQGDPLKIHALTIDTSSGKPTVNVSIDNPAKCPKGLEAVWPKTLPIPIPLEKVVPGMNADFLKGMVKTLADSKTALQNKDASMLLSGLPDEGIRTKLQEMLKGLTSIDKNGDTFTVRRNNGVTEHDFGGPKISVSPTLSFKVGKNPDCPTLTDIKGITFSVPLPTELGLGSDYSTAVTEVALSAKTGAGRDAIVRTNDKMFKSVSTRLSNDLVPQTDAGGNLTVNMHMLNPLDLRQTATINVPLKFDKGGQLNMTAGEVVDILSDTAKKGIYSNAKNALEVADTAATIGTAIVKKEVRDAVKLVDTAATVGSIIVITEVQSAVKTAGKVYDYIFK